MWLNPGGAAWADGGEGQLKLWDARETHRKSNPNFILLIFSLLVLWSGLERLQVDMWPYVAMLLGECRPPHLLTNPHVPWFTTHFWLLQAFIIPCCVGGTSSFWSLQIAHFWWLTLVNLTYLCPQLDVHRTGRLYSTLSTADASGNAVDLRLTALLVLTRLGDSAMGGHH